MLFKIILEPLLALTMIRNLVQEFIEDIEEIDIRDIYGCDGMSNSECNIFISADQKFWILSEKLKFDEALTQCRSQKADLYYVRADQDLLHLFGFFNVTKIWTNVSKARQGALQDGQGYYPELMGKSQTISLENFNPTDFKSNTRILLQQRTDSFEMKIVPESELHDALCVQSLRFPYREADQANLKGLQKTYVEALQANLDSLEPVIRKTQSAFNAIPKTSYNLTGELTFDDVVHRGAELEQNILREKRLGKVRKDLFASLTDLLGISRIGVRLLTQLYRITNMVKFVTDTIENPLVAVEQIFNSAYLWSEDKKLPYELYRIDEDLVLQIGESVLKNIPTITEMMKRTSFWDFSFFDLILFILAVCTIAVVFTTTVCLQCNKNRHSIAQLREEQRKTGRIAMDYTVKKVQTVRPIKETKIQRPFTGSCNARRRHSIDIPTTMKITRSQRVKIVTEKSKRPAPTIPRPMQSISNVPTYLQDSFTSLNE